MLNSPHNALFTTNADESESESGGQVRMQECECGSLRGSAAMRSPGVRVAMRECEAGNASESMGVPVRGLDNVCGNASDHESVV
jgi:hypothetical protein